MWLVSDLTFAYSKDILSGSIPCYRSFMKLGQKRITTQNDNDLWVQPQDFRAGKNKQECCLPPNLIIPLGLFA